MAEPLFDTESLESELVAAIRQGEKSKVRLFASIEALEKTTLRLKAERDEAVEIVTLIAEKLPEGCECCFEQIEGRTVGARCLPHRALDLLENLR